MGKNIIPTDKPSVFEILATLSNLERQAIVRPNNPPPGIGGFLFDVVQDDAIELTSDITDHFVENNTAIQDQIALKPETITVRGLQAELTDGKATTPPQVPQADPLPLNEPLVPLLAPEAEETQAETQTAQALNGLGVTSQESLYGYFEGLEGFNERNFQQPRTNKQTKAFLYFFQLWKGRQLFSVETPWGIMTNVAILSMRVEQSEETKYASELRVTFKKIRIAGELDIQSGELAGRAALQTAPVTQNGNVGKTPQTPAQKESWLYKMLNPSTQ